MHDDENFIYLTGNKSINLTPVENIVLKLSEVCKKENIEIDDEVLYLIEPSTIKLNKLTLINPNVFKELEGKKIILNKCLLSDNDIDNFEVEANIKVYYTIPPLNDKEDCSSIFLPLLEKLGYVKAVVKEEDNSKKKSIFDLFKSK